MRKWKAIQFDVFIIFIVLIFSGFNIALANDEPLNIASNDYSSSETENIIVNDHVELYVPSEEEYAVTKIINNIKDDTKRRMIYDFWVSPAFCISGESMNDTKIKRDINLKLIEEYTYLASLPTNKLEAEFNRINEETYKYYKSIPGIEVERI